MHELHAFVCRRFKPIVVKSLGQDELHHAFFILGLVVVANERVIIRIDGQYGDAVYSVPGTGIAPLLPQAGDAHCLTVCPRNACGDRLS